jgi:glycosyltransferase involved in cell wall biosynthesis
MQAVKVARFLFIAANEGNSWGGSEFLWSSAAERLLCRNNEVHVSAKDWGKPIPGIERLRSAGCKIFHRRPPALHSRLFRKALPRPPYAYTHMQKAGKDVDLVVISQGANVDGLQWMEAARALGLSYAVIAQAAAEEWWPADDAAERLSVCYEGARAAYFVSKANLALSRRQFGTPLPRARVVRNPFNVSYDAKPPWPTGFADGLSLACVARLDVAHKGQDLLLEVLNLPHWRERKIRVALVGNGTNERGLRRIVEQLKLSSVEFTGYLNGIEQVWSRYDALVLPSRYEGLPLAIVEAMLCGRPCIVTDVAGHKELVRDGVNGFLAKAPTVDLLDEAMNRAWESRGRLREMGDVAGRDVRQWVSADPSEDFVRELTALVGEVGAK